MTAINEALTKISVVKISTWLPLSPAFHSGELTIEKAKMILEEKEKARQTNPFGLKLYTLTGYKNIKFDEFEYAGFECRLVTNIETKEEMLEFCFEEDLVDKYIGGPW